MLRTSGFVDDALVAHNRQTTATKPADKQQSYNNSQTPAIQRKGWEKRKKIRKQKKITSLKKMCRTGEYVK